MSKIKHPRKNVEEILLHCDNACPHVAHTITKFSEKRGIKTVPHPPYSPDFDHVTSWYSEILKNPRLGVRFESNEYAIKTAEAQCKELSKNGLSLVFQKWQELWIKCIALERGYFEKDRENLEWINFSTYRMCFSLLSEQSSKQKKIWRI